MLHYLELNKTLETLNYEIVKDNKKVEFINLESGFDIETTSYKIGEVKTAFMYVWQFGIGYGNPVYYGRTWEEFKNLLQLLSNHFQTNLNRRLVIYVHNLSYEFQFMRKYLDWESVFSISERKPIRALTTDGIEFRDSYILSGYSLANTAKNLAKHKIKKLIGDLDYNLIRTHKTPLTREEINYCINDINIILAYINEQIEFSNGIHNIPMTNTGRVRSYVRNRCYYEKEDGTKAGKGYYFRYRKIMEDLTIEPLTYLQLKSAFMGGFTHANANHSGKLLHNVSSIDFTSSYPSVMVSEKFPMSKFKPIKIKSLEQFEYLCANFCVIFVGKFTNVTPKIEQENYLSESKVVNLKNPVINNGRINSAEQFTTTLTNVDYDIMKQCYNWEELEITAVKYANSAYLPKQIITSVLKLYQDKTELKDVAGYEVEYLLSKGMLNSIYGMCVTDVVKDQSIYNDEWETEKADINEEITKYNESKNRFLYYAWGVFITAYARRNLWTGIIAVGNDYVYSDTDSLKILNYDKHKPYIEWFDNQIISKMVTMCKHYKIDTKLLNPKTKEGIPKMLGVWDYEGTYQNFKTLGAKRYLTDENGKLQLTVAGLSKQNGLKYLKEQSKGDIIKLFELFNDNLYIPADRTGKMTHTYIDDLLEFEVIDYLGERAFISTQSGVHLENCDFTLSISKTYKDFIKKLSQGYIYKGVKYI